MREIVDGKDAIMGRLGSYVAKQLLRGNEIIVINSEEVIFSGNKDVVVEKLKKLRAMGGGGSLKGPNISKLPDRILKRKIRGMLPWDSPKGKEAYKRLRCYVGKGKLGENELKNVKIFDHNFSGKYVKLKEVAKSL